ncbi:hypothetical protein [Terrabacter sp. 2YAF2]|uniref:hypothetical protein n=1 Tax=Terrabacter sp. 2YAF2 TaxID=3233026 RepID=UPI003F959B5C
MDTSDLADLVPGLMASHPKHAWVVMSGRHGGEDLIVEIHPALAPERRAQVQVFRGAEVYFMDFAGHSSKDFAYEDEDRPEALQGRIELAVRATLGPTRVVLERAGDVIVRSVMVIDPDGPAPDQDMIVTRPVPRVAARLRGQEVTREVLEFPAIKQ